MASPRPSSAKGFTLTEVLVVIGLFALLAAIAGVASTSDFRGSALRDERASVLSALRKARGDAMANRGETPRGVRVDAEGVVIFAGASYASRDEAEDERVPRVFPVEYPEYSVREVVFEQLSGEALCDGAPCSTEDRIVLWDPVRGVELEIAVGAEGRIE